MNGLTDERLMVKLGLRTVDGQLTNAGELMLCRHANTAAGRVLYLYRRTVGAEPIVIERFDQPLPDLLDKLDELIWTRRETVPVNYPDGTQVSIASFPKAAVREALANALLHGDWRYGNPVQVDQSPESLIITSPGSLVDGVSEDNVLTVGSTPRNRMLFDAATHLRMSERAGQGIDRIYRELIGSGQDVPIILNSESSVTVRMAHRAPRTELVTLIGTLPRELRESLHVLLTLLSLTTRRTIDAGELAMQSQNVHAKDDCAAILLRLTGDSLSILEPTAETASHRYPRYRLRAESLQRLGRAVAYHRADPMDLDNKVRRHLADYAEINNRTLQSLFDVDVERARRMLSDLRRRGLIEKLPGPRRGPGVRYRAGPEL